MRVRGRVTTGGAGLAAIAALVVLLSSGCGYGGVASAASHPDVQNGQKLFSTPSPTGQPACSSCHTLQAAGSHGTVGPNLDNAFAGSRKQGYGDNTITNLVLDQIRLGSDWVLAQYKSEKDFTSAKCLNPDTKQQCYGTPMPANLWTGQNAIDIAAYVASVAGVSGYTLSGPIGTSGAAIFKSAGCGGCHTLKAAGANGTVGPNLDQLASALTVPIVVRQVTNGGGVMPSFKSQLTPAQIQAVAQYVVSNAGK